MEDDSIVLKLINEITRLENRLEMHDKKGDYKFKDTDGIYTRDATIKLQEEYIAELHEDMYFLKETLNKAKEALLETQNRAHIMDLVPEIDKLLKKGTE